MEETQGKKIKAKKTSEEVLEIVIAIALGVTALLTAWASWIGSLHGGNQATNYTKSSNMSAEANATWNEASQSYLADLQTWNTISDLIIEKTFAEQQGDTVASEKYDWKIEQVVTDNCTDEFADAISWALDQEEYASPFDMEGYFDSYYADAVEQLNEADALLQQGQSDNANGDRYGLVTVFYSVVMFLLGIVGTFKSIKNKYVLLAVAAICFVFATVIMFTIPMPTGFSLSSFISF